MTETCAPPAEATHISSPTSAATRARLKGLASLPPLPRRSQELLQLLTDPELNIRNLIEIIEQTPALAARVLGIAASPFFKSVTPVRNLSDAIIRLLGLSLVRDLSLSLILSQPFQLQRCRRFQPLYYWRHAMMTATLAQMLAPAVQAEPLPSPSDGYLGGLIHSLGLLGLAHVEPTGLNQALERWEQDPSSHLSDIELELLGLDHCTAGGDIAQIWHLPLPFVATLRHHRDLTYRGEHWPLVRLVTLAERTSKAALAAECPASGADLRSVLAELGISETQWERILGWWQERVADIDAVAAVLADRRG